jgi:hypothetical protein
VLAEVSMARTNLSQLATGDSLDSVAQEKLLAAMKRHSRPEKPAALGVIGREHVAGCFAAQGCKLETFDYKKVVGETDGVPWVMEVAFGYAPDARDRRFITGVNWSPGIVNPFRQLGKYGRSLDTILQQRRAGPTEPIVLLLHIACPRVEYTDRGKSAVVVGGQDSAMVHVDQEEEGD